MKNLKKLLNNIVSQLIVVNISYGILDILLSSFLVSYIMRSFSNQIIGVAIFYICWTITIAIGFFLAAHKTKCGNKMAVFRVSIILRILACIVLGTIRLNMPVAIFVGCLLGFADGYMNMPWHTILSDKLSKQQLIQYTGYKTSVSHIMKVFLPLIIGIFISMSSYSMMVWLVIPFSLISYLVSFTIHTRPSSCEGLQIRRYFRQCTKDTFTRRLLTAEFIRGMSIDRMSYIITMLIVFVMHTDVALGGVKSVTSLVTIFVSALIGRYLVIKAFPRILTICCSFMIVSTLLFLGLQTAAMLVVYTLVYSVAERVFSQLLEMNVTNGSNYNSLNRGNKIEYFLVREVFLNLGRLSHLVLLLILGLCGGGVLGLTLLALSMVIMAVPLARMSVQNSRDIIRTA